MTRYFLKYLVISSLIASKIQDYALLTAFHGHSGTKTLKFSALCLVYELSVDVLYLDREAECPFRVFLDFCPDVLLCARELVTKLY